MIKQFTDNRGDFTIFDAKECDQVNIVNNPESEHSIVWDSVPQVKEVIMSHIKNVNNLVISEKDMNGK